MGYQGTAEAVPKKSRREAPSSFDPARCARPEMRTRGIEPEPLLRASESAGEILSELEGPLARWGGGSNLSPMPPFARTPLLYATGYRLPAPLMTFGTQHPSELPCYPTHKNLPLKTRESSARDIAYGAFPFGAPNRAPARLRPWHFRLFDIPTAPREPSRAPVHPGHSPAIRD